MFDKSLKREIKEIAVEFDLEPEALMAIVEVESHGKLGTWINGKLEPLIRFEGHYFYRLLPNRKRNLAITQGLAHASAGKIKNPWRQKARWKLLGRASALDRDAAFASTSWGVGQVMGSHWKWLGYSSVDALVMEARRGTIGQIALMMRYVEKADLVAKLQSHDWAGFARAYNGPAYRKNKYDQKMRSAYLRHKGLGKVFAPANGIAILRFGSFGPAVRHLQQNLSSLGYTLRIDGDFGYATENAVKAFQAGNCLAVDGAVGSLTIEVMRRKLPPIAA